MAKLNIMIGIPGSGKTRYAKTGLSTDNTIYLSSDDIRVNMFGFEDQTHNTEVFERMKRETLIALKNGFDVIYDATNLNKKHRSDIIKRAKMCEAEVNAYLCCTPINIILERNLTRQERQIPWDKLIQMIQSIEPPMYYEGFDNIYLIGHWDEEDIYSYYKLEDIMRNYKQDNPYHTETLLEHTNAVIDALRNDKFNDILGKYIEINSDIKTNHCMYWNPYERYKNYGDVGYSLKRRTIEIAAIYHDFGKLYTRQFNKNKNYYSYYNHERVSTYMFMCNIYSPFAKEGYIIKLSDENYQIGALILNHMEWYRREDMTPIKEMFNDDNLYRLLELLHEADQWGRNENAIKEDKQ